MNALTILDSYKGYIKEYEIKNIDISCEHSE